MVRATAALILAAAGLGACVPPLPGGSLGESNDGGPAGRASSGGAGAIGGAPSAVEPDASTGGPDGGGGTIGIGGVGGGAMACRCPSIATFCADFETPGLAAGAIYATDGQPADWDRDFAIDSTQQRCGTSSLLVKNVDALGSSQAAYRLLAVPAPTGPFWARFWIMSDAPIGGGGHNAFAGGSTGSTPNDSMIEFAEDAGIAFAYEGNDVWPTGYGRLPNGITNPFALPTMTWACVELSYDGTGHVQQLFINGTYLINATNYPSDTLNLTYFKFGFQSFDGPARQIWYDGVAVAATRIGCD